MKIENKKAQEEIVGFVAIVLIVSIIMIVFLGLFLRKENSGQGNIEVSQFLEALMETTTDCSNNGGFTYKRYSELIILCYENNSCSGENACDMLNKYTKEMIENSWDFGGDNVKKGYEYKLSFVSEVDNGKELRITEGVGKWGAGGFGRKKYMGSERSISVNDGRIALSLDLYLE